MGTTNTNFAANGTRASIADEIKNAAQPGGKPGAAAGTAPHGLAENNRDAAVTTNSRSVAPGVSRGVPRGIEKPPGNAIKNPSIAPADKSSSVAGDATRKNLSKAIMLAAGRSATAKTRRVPAKELGPGFAASFPAMMPIASDTGTRPAFPREAIPALRLHFQSSRAEYVERRLNPHNEGVIELYCKLCLRLIVASRDEFVFPIAVKAHKCGRNTRSSMRRW